MGERKKPGRNKYHYKRGTTGIHRYPDKVPVGKHEAGNRWTKGEKALIAITCAVVTVVVLFLLIYK